MTVAEAQVDVLELQKNYKSDASFRIVCDHLAGRERNRQMLKLERLLANVAAEGQNLTRSEAISVLRRFQELGCGSFIPGRRGHASRFAWQVNMSSVGRVAAGETVHIDEVQVDETDEDGEAETMTLEHRYQLRPNSSVVIRLPMDLNAAEAGRLADFIRTLPFS